jgi:hypothetical protein
LGVYYILSVKNGIIHTVEQIIKWPKKKNPLSAFHQIGGNIVFVLVYEPKPMRERTSLMVWVSSGF